MKFEWRIMCFGIFLVMFHAVLINGFPLVELMRPFETWGSLPNNDFLIPDVISRNILIQNTHLVEWLCLSQYDYVLVMWRILCNLFFYLIQVMLLVRWKVELLWSSLICLRLAKPRSKFFIYVYFYLLIQMKESFSSMLAKSKGRRLYGLKQYNIGK